MPPGPAPTVGPGPAPTVGPPPVSMSPLFGALVANTTATIGNTSAMLRAAAAQKVAGAVQAPTAGGAAPKVSHFKELAEAARNFGRAAEGAWAQGSQGILSLVSAADPSAFSTFNASLTAVSIQVGQIFVPALLSLSNTLQGVAGWFANLDPFWKSAIGNTVVWTLGITGVVHALRLFVPVITLATTAIRLLTTAWKASPLGLAVAGIGLAVGAVSALAGNWSNAGRAARAAGEDMEEAAARAMRPGERLNDWIMRLSRLNWGGARPGDRGPENLKLPFQSRTTSFEQYGESLQMKALETDDLDKKNQLEVLRATLARMGEQQELLRTIAGNGQRLNEVLAGLFR